MKYIYYSILVSIMTLLLVSCWAKPDEEGVAEEVQKNVFFIDIQKFGDFSQESKIKKIWKITGAQDITMTAAAPGRVVDIRVKAGDNVVPGQTLAVLDDNATNYGISVQRSQNALERSQINYDSQVLSLDKQVSDAEINLEKLEKNLLALKQTTNQNIQKAQNDVDNINPDKTWSKAALDVEKLANTIEKLEWDYQSLLVSDTQVIEWYQSSLQNIFNSYATLLWDAAQFGDELFGISTFNRNVNDGFDAFLWVNDLSQKTETRSQAAAVMKISDSQSYLDLNTQILESDMTNAEILAWLEYLVLRYNEMDRFLKSVETTINNSLKNAGTFGDSEIAALMSELNGYQSQLQSNRSTLSSFNTSTKTFLNTYQSNQQSVLKQIQLTQKDKEILVKALNNTTADAILNFENIVISQSDQINNLETQIKTARSTLSNARLNRSIALSNANNAISDARINYSEANQNYGKLIISAPVAGTIGDVFIDLGQEIFNGNNLLTLTSNTQREISLGFSKNEIGFVNKNDEVFLESLWTRYTGKILSLSSVADSSLNYKATIWFDASVDLLWDLVSVYVLAKNPNILVPVNIIEVVKPGVWFIKVLSDGKVENIEVQLWNIWEDEIEILSGLDAGADVITNNISNYDPNKFELTVRK